MNAIESLAPLADIDPLWVLIGVLSAGLVAAIVLAVSALRLARGLRRQMREMRREQQRQSNALMALHGAMKVIAEDVITHGQSQSAVTRTLARLSDQQSELRLREVDDGLYSQAIELVRHGKGREEVRKLCGLTHAEVELLFSLHARSGRG